MVRVDNHGVARRVNNVRRHLDAMSNAPLCDNNVAMQ